VLTGGMLGGVLLTASPASAAVTTTSTSVSATAHGSTIDVHASVSPAGGGGSISVSSTSGGGCTIQVGGGMGGPGFGGGMGGPGFGGGGGGGSCQITGAGPGMWTVTATYTPADTTDYTGSTNSTSVTVAGSQNYNPPQQNNNNQQQNNHQQQQNNYRNYNHYAETNLSTSLSCTSPVHIGGSGSCTLWVSNSNRNFFFGPGQYNNNNYGPNYNNNFGQDFASDVTAQVSLPWPLRAEYCGSYYSGCHIYGNTAYENIGNLYPGQSASLTVHFRVQPGFNIWGYDHGNPFLVIVHGSASSNHGIFTSFGRGQSSSTAYVWIRR